MAASARSETLVSSTRGDSRSQWDRTGAVVNDNFSFWKAESHSGDQYQGTDLRDRQVRGVVIFE